MKLLSLTGLGAMLVALLGLWRTRSLFSPNPVVIGFQLAAVLLMIWARVTFGLRSFKSFIAAKFKTAAYIILVLFICELVGYGYMNAYCKPVAYCLFL